MKSKTEPGSHPKLVPASDPMLVAIDKAADRIRPAGPHQTIDLSDLGGVWRDVTFLHDEEAPEAFYWSGRMKTRARTMFPMRSAHLVKTFKTLPGAKRNFLRQFAKSWMADVGGQT